MSGLLKKSLKKVFKSRVFIYLTGWFIYFYVRLAKISTKWHTEGLEEALKLMEKQPTIALIWHGRALIMPAFWPLKNKAKTLVSQHRDGRLIAKFLHHYGMQTIDGSSTNNAKGSALTILRTLQDGLTVGIIPDGPIGPNQILGKSPIYFAQKTGAPIIHASYSVKGSRLVKKSWDQMLLPKLFSQGFFLVSKPIYIPQNLSDNEVEAYRQKIERQMNDLQNRADDYAGIPRVTPGLIIKKKKRG